MTTNALVIDEGNPIPLTATLTDNSGDPLAEKSVRFVLTPTGGGSTIEKAVITNPAGKARLGNLAVPPGDYTIATFLGTSVLKSSSSSTVSLTVEDGTPPPGACPAVPGNLLQNHCFEAGEGPWSFFTNGKGSYETSPLNPYEGSASAEVTIDQGGSNLQLYQKEISLKPNTLYELSFAAYSSNGRDLSVYVHKHGADYDNYGLAGFQVNMGTDWQTYSTTFTTNDFGGVGEDARLRFWLAPFDQSGMTYHFDSIRAARGAGGRHGTGRCPKRGREVQRSGGRVYL